MTTPRPYSRVYHEIVEHPRFERVYRNPSALGTWLQLLLTADAMYPMPAPMPPRTPTVRLLIDCGLVIVRTGNRYSMRGLSEERERRSDAARNAAAMRWQSGRNAEPMPRRDETRLEEKSSAVARENRPLTEADRDALLAENMRLMNDPKAEAHVRRAAEKTVARLREGRATA